MSRLRCWPRLLRRPSRRWRSAAVGAAHLSRGRASAQVEAGGLLKERARHARMGNKSNVAAIDARLAALNPRRQASRPRPARSRPTRISVPLPVPPPPCASRRGSGPALVAYRGRREARGAAARSGAQGSCKHGWGGGSRSLGCVCWSCTRRRAWSTTSPSSSPSCSAPKTTPQNRPPRHSGSPQSRAAASSSAAVVRFCLSLCAFCFAPTCNLIMNVQGLRTAVGRFCFPPNQ